MTEQRLIATVKVLAWTLALGVPAGSASAHTILHVDDDAPTGGDGLSWETAFNDLQDALDLARADSTVEEIWIAGGTYLPDRGTGDRDLSFLPPPDVGLFGGFHGNEAHRPPRAGRSEQTILSGEIGEPGDADDNSKAVLILMDAVENVQLDNLVFQGAMGTWGAVQVRAYNDGTVISGCRFVQNVGIWGGGMFLSDSNECEVRDCVFEDNAANHGGGLYLNNNPSLTEVVNCRFYNNHAFGFGGAVANSSSYPIFRNCTFYGNSADREGGAISNSGGAATFLNSILWQNTPFEIRNQKSDTTIDYSCITGGWPGAGNLDLAPGFVDPESGDLRLAANSPCIDAGDNTRVPAGQTLDLDFNPRFADDPGTADTGNGTSPIVDMGCYEFQGTSFAVLEPLPGEAGRINRFQAIGAQPGERLWFIHGREEGLTIVPVCPEVVIAIADPQILGSAIADGEGVATVERLVPQGARGLELLLQCGSLQRCAVTGVVGVVFE